MNSSRKSTSGAKSVGVDVVVEHPRPVFEVAEDSTELLSPKVWCTWFWNPARITASRYHAPLSVNRVSETPCSQSTNLSAFSVVPVSETPNEMGCLVTASTATQTYSGWLPHFTTLSSTAVAPSFALARSEALPQPFSSNPERSTWKEARREARRIQRFF